MALAVVATIATMAAFWAPAMALLSDAADAAGLDQGMGFALTNLAWAGGQVLGGSGGAKLAESVGDAAPYAVCAVLCGVTLAGVGAWGGRVRRAEA